MENLAKKRISDDFGGVFAKSGAYCAVCVFRDRSKYGYRKYTCIRYPQGKPHDVLYENGECEKFLKAKIDE